MEDVKENIVLEKPKLGRPKKRIFTTKDQEDAYNAEKIAARAGYKKQYYNTNKKWYLAKSKSIQIEKMKIKLKTLEDDLADLISLIEKEVEEENRELLEKE